MKQLKKMLLVLMCVCVMLGCVACGNKEAADNGANQTENNMNDATDGTDDGVVGEIGEDVVDGVDNVGEDVVDGVEDIGDDVENAVNGNDTVDYLKMPYTDSDDDDGDDVVDPEIPLDGVGIIVTEDSDYSHISKVIEIDEQIC